MRSALVGAIVLILVAASLGTGYEFGNANTHTEATTSTAVSSTTLTEVSTATTTVTTTSSPTWTVLIQNGTFTGPGCPPVPSLVLMALRIPCLDYTNSTTWYASLLEYNGKDFYARSETLVSESTGASITYDVWFDNSTAYCVSPFLAASELPTCPPP